MKVLCFLPILALPIFAHAGNFGWNKSFDGSFGYSRLLSDFGTDSYGNIMPVDLVHFDISGCGVYAGCGFMTQKTGYDVYGYDERVYSFVLKLGPSFMYCINEESRLKLNPFIGYGFGAVSDTSNNEIGQRQDYGARKYKFVVGGKIVYSYKGFNVGVHASNVDVGMSIGFTINYD